MDPWIRSLFQQKTLFSFLNLREYRRDGPSKCIKDFGCYLLFERCRLNHGLLQKLEFYLLLWHHQRWIVVIQRRIRTSNCLSWQRFQVLSPLLHRRYVNKSIKNLHSAFWIYPWISSFFKSLIWFLSSPALSQYEK